MWSVGGRFELYSALETTLHQPLHRHTRQGVNNTPPTTVLNVCAKVSDHHIY